MAEIRENGSEIVLTTGESGVVQGRRIELDERITATVDSEGKLLELRIDDVNRPLSNARARKQHLTGLNLFAEPSEPDWPGIG